MPKVPTLIPMPPIPATPTAEPYRRAETTGIPKRPLHVQSVRPCRSRSARNDHRRSAGLHTTAAIATIGVLPSSHVPDGRHHRALRSTQSSEESNAPRVRCWRQRRRGGSGGVVADIAKLSVGREEYYTRELATDHEQYLSGHGESPGRWYGAGASQPRAAGRSIGGRVPGHVRGPRPHHWRAAGPPPWPQRRARLRRGPAADQERLDPLRPR